MLNNSADNKIREVKSLLQTERKFKAQNEIDMSVAERTFEEVQGLIQTGSKTVELSESCSAARVRREEGKWKEI